MLSAGLVHDRGPLLSDVRRATRFPSSTAPTSCAKWAGPSGIGIGRRGGIYPQRPAAPSTEHELAPENLTPAAWRGAVERSDGALDYGIAPPPDATKTEVPDLAAEGLNEERPRAILQAAEDVRSLVAMLKG